MTCAEFFDHCVETCRWKHSHQNSQSGCSVCAAVYGLHFHLSRPRDYWGVHSEELAVEWIGWVIRALEEDRKQAGM